MGDDAIRLVPVGSGAVIPAGKTMQFWTKPEGAAAGWGSWPAYRVSNSQFWTMQHRLWDCFRQQRTAEPVFASDVTIALSVFMAGKGNGGEAQWPGVKR